MPGRGSVVVSIETGFWMLVTMLALLVGNVAMHIRVNALEEKLNIVEGANLRLLRALERIVSRG